MPAMNQSACGKAILLGEHAVVHGEGAIAIPLSNKRVKVHVEPKILAPDSKIHVIAPDLDINQELSDLPKQNPIFQAVRLTLSELNITQTPSCKLLVTSTLAFSSGLGSSAALAVATTKALSEFLGHPLTVETVNRIAYECETYIHGNPSGIDNTVVSYEKPLYFQKSQGFEFLHPGGTFNFVLADSGTSKSTQESVASVAQQLVERPMEGQAILTQIGQVVEQGKQAFLDGDTKTLAIAMNHNQQLLAALDLSSPGLDQLIKTAREAGALAAKLTGGGRGGHMLALVEDSKLPLVYESLQQASSDRAFIAIVRNQG